MPERRGSVVTLDRTERTMAEWHAPLKRWTLPVAAAIAGVVGATLFLAMQPVVKVWRRTETGEAPRWQGATPGSPTRVSQRVGVGATENIGSI